MHASQLGISRRKLEAWAQEMGLRLVPSLPVVDAEIDPVEIARMDDLRSHENTAKVYFVQEGSAGLIKIGCSKNLKKRFDEIARELPYDLKLLAFVDGWREVEVVFHLRFAHARVRGEWFRPVPELLAYIEEIR